MESKKEKEKQKERDNNRPRDRGRANRYVKRKEADSAKEILHIDAGEKAR